MPDLYRSAGWTAASAASVPAKLGLPCGYQATLQMLVCVGRKAGQGTVCCVRPLYVCAGLDGGVPLISAIRSAPGSGQRTPVAGARPASRAWARATWQAANCSGATSPNWGVMVRHSSMA
jgi:hypothetical protein